MTRSVSFGLVFAAIVVVALILGFCSSTKNSPDTAASGQGSPAASATATQTATSADAAGPTPVPADASGATGEASSPATTAPASTAASKGGEAEAPAQAVPSAASSAESGASAGSATTTAGAELTVASADSAGTAASAVPPESPADAGAADTPATSAPATAAAGDAAAAATAPAAEQSATSQSPAISVVTVVPAETQQAALPPAESAEANGEGVVPAVQEPVRPSFDVVRVDPSGNLVLAGRGAPGDEIVVTSDGRVVGMATADGNGEWAIVPDSPLPPGNHRLALAQKQADGKVVEADKLVMIAVPEQVQDSAGATTAAGDGSLVVMVPSDDSGGAVVLQNPLPEPTDGIASGALVLDAVDYDDNGAVTVGGRGTVGAAIRVYLDNQLIGSTTVDASGRWQVTPAAPVAPRLHTLRVDQIAPDGKVAARVESPFLRAELIDLPADQAFIVQPGNSLWRIARRTYGEGVRYTTIYQANLGQIRDPDLIYPGQVFSIPPQAQTN